MIFGFTSGIAYDASSAAFNSLAGIALKGVEVSVTSISFSFDTFTGRSRLTPQAAGARMHPITDLRSTPQS